MTIIEAASPWRFINIKELWGARELIAILVARDLKVRYKQATLGVIWVLLQPLLVMLVLSFVFSRIERIPSQGERYPLFFLSALVPWFFFSNVVAAVSNSLLASTNMLTKVYFPRLVIPLAVTGAYLLDLAIGVMLIFLFFAVYDVPMRWSMVYLFPILALLAILAFAVGTFFSALIVRYRDIRFIVPILLQTLFFASPIFYSLSMIPGEWRWIFNLNPIAGVIEAIRASLFGTDFNIQGILIAIVVSLVGLVISILLFRRMERNLADII